MFTLALAAVMFSGMVVCMGMFLKHVIQDCIRRIRCRETDDYITHPIHGEVSFRRFPFFVSGMLFYIYIYIFLHQRIVILPY